MRKTKPSPSISVKTATYNNKNQGWEFFLQLQFMSYTVASQQGVINIFILLFGSSNVNVNDITSE